MLDSIARYFRAIAEFRDELRRRLRPYAAMLYFGALLLAVSTILTIVILGGSLVSTGITSAGLGALRVTITAKDIALLLLATVTGIMVSSWLMGFVVGKIEELSAAAGFTHSIILTLASAVASTIAMIGSVGTLIPP